MAGPVCRPQGMGDSTKYVESAKVARLHQYATIGQGLLLAAANLIFDRNFLDNSLVNCFGSDI